MRRLLVVFMLICALSLPVLGGHHQLGGYWCNCTPVEGTCPCCGFSGLAAEPDQENVSTAQSAVSESRETTQDWDIALTVLLTWLKVIA
jgi:hypothetical protein